MSISVVEPVGQAIERVKVVLFRPFDIGKWFILGFCAFLAYLGQGGGGTGGNPAAQWQQNSGGPSGREIADWIEAHLAVILTVSLAVVALLLVLGALLTWLSSRGKFMFLDGVVRNRAAVVEPWSTYAPLANSLFRFRFIVGLLFFALVLSVLMASAIVAWPDLEASEFGERAVTAIIVAGVGMFLLMFMGAVISTLLEDFVVPTMYQFGLPVMDGWSTVADEVIRGRVGTIVLYFLMKIVLGIAIGVIAVVATCATCCAASIPYLGTVILLPVYVFLRCYPIYFLEQLGPDWRFFVEEPPVVEAAAEPPMSDPTEEP